MKPSPSIFAGLSFARAGCRTGALALAQEVHRFAHMYQLNRSVYIYCSEPAKRMHAWFDGKLKMEAPWKVPMLWPEFAEKMDKQLLALLDDAAALCRVVPLSRPIKEMLVRRVGFVAIEA